MLHGIQVGTLCEPLTGARLDATASMHRVGRRASYFKAAGVSPGSVVCLHYGNETRFFIDVLAVWANGSCVVPVDPRLTESEIGVLYKSLRPAAAVWPSEPPAEVAGFAGAYGVALLDPDSVSENVGGPEQIDVDAVAPDGAAVMLLTSGTTGSPKAVVHTHRAIRTRWEYQRTQMGLAASERTLCMLPTNFAWGLLGNALYAWLSGQELYLVPAFRSDALVQMSKLCDDNAITYLPTVPSMWRVALRTVAPPRRGTLRRIACGTSPFPAALWRDIQKWSGLRDVWNVYSMTEFGVIAAQSGSECDPIDGLVGSPFNGTEIRVVPADTAVTAVATSDECPPGQEGMICARSATVMQGYFERPDLTAEVLNDGWFVTGDIGMRDENGRLVLRGRIRELVNAGGVKVYPEDVDRVLARCSGVSDACTFGEPDPLHGEQVAVAIVLGEDSRSALAAVYQVARQELAAHQLPRRWYVVPKIERTKRGKLNRAMVAEACRGLPAVADRVLAAHAASNSR